MTTRDNILWNLAGSGLPLIAAVALIPFTLKTLGNEIFGVLTIVWVLIGYLSLFDMGVGRSLTYEVSRLNASSLSQIPQALKAGILLTFFTGALGALLVWFLAPYLAAWLKVSPHLQNDTISAFKLCALAVIPTTITSGLRGALEGLDRFSHSNLIKLIIGFSMFGVPAISIWLQTASLTAIALYLCLVRVAVLFLALWHLRQYLIVLITVHIGKKNFSNLLNYGFWVTVTGVLGPLMVYGDRFFISNILGAAQLPFYAIPQEGLLRLLIVPGAFAAALMPLFSAAQNIDLKRIYQIYFNKIAKIMMALCVLAAIGAYPFLYFWLSPAFAGQTILMVLILLIGIFLNGLSMVPYTLLQARGKPKLTAYYHIAELVIYIPLIWLLVNSFGLLGAALAWVFRVLIDFLLLHHTAKKLNKRQIQPLNTLAQT